MESATYLIINLLTLAGPLCMGWESSVNFRGTWRLLAWTIPSIAFPFIVWDVWFTAEGVWRFNPHYYLGLTMAFLPLEEVAFFFTIPFACLYLYEIVRRNRLRKASSTLRYLNILAFLLGVLLLLAVPIVINRSYTAAVCCGGGLCLLHASRKTYLGVFLIAYLLHLIPFLLVNGILTGLPVVLYNPAENLNLRVGTIPVEDFVYSLILLYGNVALREHFGSELNLPPK